jgi:hypothetical protein
MAGDVQSPRFITGDINLDGKNDIIEFNLGEYDALVYINNPSATPQKFDTIRLT